jgi:hypothetical protein
MANGARHPGSFGVRRPDRSVRIQPGSFTQDPGMRAPDEFSDVTSAGYRESAKRVAERGGARQDATSVEEEERKKQADEVRNLVLMALVALSTYGGATGRLARPAPPPGRYEPQPIRDNMLNRWTARREMRRPHTEVTVDMDAWAQQRPTIPMNPGAIAAAPSPRPGPNMRAGGWQGNPGEFQIGQTRIPTREDLLDYLRKTYGGGGTTYPFPRMGN